MKTKKHTFRPPTRFRPLLARIRVLGEDVPIRRPDHETVVEIRVHDFEPAARGVVLPRRDGPVAQVGEAGGGVVRVEDLEEGVEGGGVGEAFAVDELVEFGRLGYFVEGEGHGCEKVVEEGLWIGVMRGKGVMFVVSYVRNIWYPRV